MCRFIYIATCNKLNRGNYDYKSCVLAGLPLKFVLSKPCKFCTYCTCFYELVNNERFHNIHTDKQIQVHANHSYVAILTN